MFKPFVCLSLLSLSACDCSPHVESVTFVTDVGGCKMYCIQMRDANNVFTTICPNGKASAQQDVKEGKTTREQRVDTN